MSTFENPFDKRSFFGEDSVMEMILRDTFKDRRYWIERLDLLKEDEGFFRDMLSTNLAPSKKNRNAMNALVDVYFEASLAKYSAGAPMDKAAKDALYAVGYLFPQQMQMYPPGSEFFTTRLGYSKTHRWIAILILCKASSVQIKAFFDALDMFDLEADDYGGYDQIWAAYRTYFDLPLNSQPGHIHWPKAFQNLWLAIDPQESDLARPQHIKKFLDGWYKEMVKQVAAQTNRPGTTNNPNSYIGYWCVEAAAAVVMMDIDDSSFRNHLHYPEDWADWARE